MFSSVHHWDGCVTLWHFLTLLFFVSEVLAGGYIFLQKYFEEKGMSDFLCTIFAWLTMMS